MRPLSPKLSWTLSGQRYQRPTDARDLPLLTPFERPSCSAAHPSAPSGNNGVSEYRSADAGEKIGEIEDLLGCHRLQRLRHLVHRLEDAQLFAKHEKLDQCVRRLLRAERGRPRALGCAARTSRSS